MDTYRDNEELKEEVAQAEQAPVEENLPQEEPAPVVQPLCTQEQAPTVIEAPAVEEKPKKKAKRKCKWLLRTVSAVLTVVFVLVSCGVTGVLVSDYWQEKLTLETAVLSNRLNVLQQQMTELKDNIGPDIPAVPQGAMTPAEVYAQNVDAVVAVICQLAMGQSFGTGFLVSADGYIVSNYHVVEGATGITVTTTDGISHRAKLIGYDSVYDVSLLKIGGSSLPYVTLGSSDATAVGDQVIAIGNPLGDELASTLTAGYISGKERKVSTDGTSINMLQTDAAINSGNSGGPLFNMRGEVIGITTAKYSGTSTSGASIEGIGFAVPMDDIKGSLADLKEFGYVRSAYLGIMAREMDKSTANMYGLPLGVYVESVTEGNCAHRAGVQAKDIIINLGGYDIETMADLTNALRKLTAGEETTITVFRGGREVSMFITLEEKPRS